MDYFAFHIHEQSQKIKHKKNVNRNIVMSIC